MSHIVHTPHEELLGGEELLCHVHYPVSLMLGDTGEVLSSGGLWMTNYRLLYYPSSVSKMVSSHSKVCKRMTVGNLLRCSAIVKYCSTPFTLTQDQQKILWDSR